MLRVVLRNLVLALVLGLPMLIIAAALFAWLVPPAWAGPDSIAVSASGFAAGFAFWYVILALPVVVFALVHQGVLATLPARTEPSHRTRSVVAALVMSLSVGMCVGVTSSDVSWVGLLGALTISSGAYGFVTRPLPLRGRLRDAAG